MVDSGGYSQQDPADSADDWSARQFQINQTLARVRTMVLVKVTAIKEGAGAIAAPGTVTVQPLVKIIDGIGNVTSHGTINNIPVFRVGGGKNAVICDPVVGDIGWMAVADRDSSVVVKTKAEAQPGSRRKFDLADGVYMGSLLGDVPEQWITFTAGGMEINAKGGHKLSSTEADGWSVDKLTITGQLRLGGDIVDDSGGTYGGDIHTTGTIFADTDVQAGSGGARVTMKGHQHPANNTPPTPGH